MITIIVVAAGRAINTGAERICHAVSHGICWLLFPRVVRTGRCMDCPDPR